MAEYESIHGTRVKYLSSDPTLNSSAEGQVWYNSTSGTNKSLVQIKAWNSSGVMPVATNNNGSATQAPQSTALSFGGGTTQSQTIEYNGSGWTAGGNLGTPRYVLSGAGTQTAGLGFGGYSHPPGVFRNSTEEYDGSSWTGGGALSSARGSIGGNGTQTAALAVGGSPLSPGTQSEEYDGSSWTAGGAYPVALQSIAIAGPQTAALGAGGISGAPIDGSTLVTNYDGSSWTVVSGTIPNGQNRAATAGTQTHAVVFGGNINTPPPAGPGTPGVVTTATNEWDGSTFAITANMATARQSYAGAGTATSAVGFGGDKNPGASNDTEEYNSSLQVLNPGVWAAGGNLNTARGQLSGSGTQTAAIVAGGQAPPGPQDASEEYNGSSWSEGNNLNTARRVMFANGPQTAAFVAGGFLPPNSNATENYNGTSWTNSGNLNTGRRHGAGAGTQTAGLAFGGYVSSPSTLTEEYNGSSWTAQNTMNSARFGLAGSGTQTAAFAFAGGNPPATPDFVLTTENYDGTSWTNSPHNINSGRFSVAGSTAGSQTASLLFGGLPDPADIGTATTEQYDGSSWSQVGGMANARSYLAGAGTSAAGLATGGNNNPWLSATEEFTSGSAAVTTASTLTTS